ncbi:hypothetical protein RA307_31755 [Xanthobacteraceae bacterium Astr-EGSB]|uniref:hypothetical protein n=1 Tax=Astrobacterium formosum TaxID=3069710 RepID=UPI0027B31A79|nr:hypothetical protein [Xanthobacteraceae bacterium Astr-EGSB]
MSDILHADSITVGACDVCPAVHVNLLDDRGEVFATGALPVELIDLFVRRLQDAKRTLVMRHAAPAGRQ